MAKCERCGRGGMGVLHYAIKFKDKKYVCFKCLKEFGYKPLKEASYLTLQTSDEVLNNANAFQNVKIELFKNAVHESYPAVGFSFDNDQGVSIQKMLSKFVKEENDGLEQYEGLSNKEIKNEWFDDKIYQFPPTECDVELEPSAFDGEPAIKVLLTDMDSVHIGWIPADDVGHVLNVIKAGDYTVSGEIVGGRYKYSDGGDDVVVDQTEYRATVYLIYEKE